MASPATGSLRAVAVFYGLTLMISLPFFLIAYALPGYGDPETPGALPVWLGMIWAPTLAAVYLWWRAGELRDRLRRLLRPGSRSARRAAVGCALSPFAIVGGTVLLWTTFTDGESAALAWPEQPGSFALFILLPLLQLAMGPLGEEFGWRGYALPRLLAELSPGRAMAAIACMWAGWHFPLWLLPDAPQSEIPIALFIAHVFCYSFWMTYLRLRFGESLWPQIGFHWAVNTALAYAMLFSNLSAAAVFWFSLPGYLLLAMIAVLLIAREEGTARSVS